MILIYMKNFKIWATNASCLLFSTDKRVFFRSGCCRLGVKRDIGIAVLIIAVPKM